MVLGLVGFGLLALGVYVTTWPRDYHGGSAWHYENQRELTVEVWSRNTIHANREYLIAAAIGAVAGLASLICERHPRDAGVAWVARRERPTSDENGAVTSSLEARSLL
ncbi:hypothetical protein [Cellulosimicrobium cellulans]|uniref:hypothetical protein n=1 Tax=Cellulosimicrobium cellulans TaxID=1710 RepID=UPI001112FD59|nr:hypothetical protein [Cellulosimicrobium cellulans]